tara:strand:- start:1148 stop:1690 length:543 start_codon:yes stop_codon:yes gene_type:complete
MKIKIFILLLVLTNNLICKTYVLTFHTENDERSTVNMTQVIKQVTKDEFIGKHKFEQIITSDVGEHRNLSEESIRYKLLHQDEEILSLSGIKIEGSGITIEGSDITTDDLNEGKNIYFMLIHKKTNVFTQFFSYPNYKLSEEQKKHNDYWMKIIPELFKDRPRYEYGEGTVNFGTVISIE